MTGHDIINSTDNWRTVLESHQDGDFSIQRWYKGEISGWRLEDCVRLTNEEWRRVAKLILRDELKATDVLFAGRFIPVANGSRPALLGDWYFTRDGDPNALVYRYKPGLIRSERSLLADDMDPSEGAGGARAVDRMLRLENRVAILGFVLVPRADVPAWWPRGVGCFCGIHIQNDLMHVDIGEDFGAALDNLEQAVVKLEGNHATDPDAVDADLGGES